MHYWTFFSNLNRIFLFSLLSVSTIANSIQPTYEIEGDYSDIAFLARIEKLTEKLFKSKNKDNDAIVSSFHALQREIENHYNIRLDLDPFFEEVKAYLRQNHLKIPPKYLNAVFKKLKKGSKRSDYSYDFKNKDNEPQNSQEVVVPSYLMYGITAIAAGAFLCFTRIPVCIKLGENLIVAGLGACASSMAEMNDDNRKKEKEKD